MKPVIGITADIDDGSRFAERFLGKRIVHLWERYLKAVQDTGGVAVLIPVSDDKQDIKLILNRIDGLLVSGGSFDVPPSYYGEKLIPQARVRPKPERSRFERELILEAVKRGMPVFGICGGEQIINVAFGGSLYQDIVYQCESCLGHEQKNTPTQVSHQVEVKPDSLLAKLLFPKSLKKRRILWVNSTHHQAVKKIGKGLKISAWSGDGIIEAIEAEKGFVIGVQWHPELLYPKHLEHRRLLTGFIRATRG